MKIEMRQQRRMSGGRGLQELCRGAHNIKQGQRTHGIHAVHVVGLNPAALCILINYSPAQPHTAVTQSMFTDASDPSRCAMASGALQDICGDFLRAGRDFYTKNTVECLGILHREYEMNDYYTPRSVG